MQEELFQTNPDNRVYELNEFVYEKVVKEDRWLPSAAELSALGDDAGVAGKEPLVAFENAIKRHCEALDGIVQDWSLGIDVEMTRDQVQKSIDKLNFYKNRGLYA